MMCDVPKSLPDLAPLNAPIQTVSVIIAVHNGSDYLGEAIESALGQTYGAVEIVVVDDGSSDGSAEIAGSYPGVKLICQENRGVARARNRGFAESSGDAILFLDQDDRLLPDNVAIGVRVLNEALTCGFTAGRARIISEDSARKGRDLARQDHIDYASVLAGNAFVPPSVVMIRHEAFVATAGFNPRYRGTDDLDLYLNLARLYPARPHNGIVVEYRRHDGNVSNDAALMLRECLRVLDDHRRFVEGDARLEEALEEGRQKWIRLFGPMLLRSMLGRLRRGNVRAAWRAFVTAVLLYPSGFLKSPVKVLRYLWKRARRLRQF